jgi:undecaprenyl-diphosphatase
LGLSQTEFQKSFEMAIQLGAIASVIVLYRRRFLDVEILKKVAVAFLPTGIIGFALYRVVETYLLSSEEVVLWALGLGGVALILFELLHARGRMRFKMLLQSLTPRPYWWDYFRAFPSFPMCLGQGQRS